MNRTDPVIERAAKDVYRLFDGAEKHPWQDGGNSYKQDEARHYVNVVIASINPPASKKIMLKADPTALVALALAGVLPNTQTEQILQEVYAPGPPEPVSNKLEQLAILGTENQCREMLLQLAKVIEK